MNAFEQFSQDQNKLIESKYQAIYQLREDILRLRSQIHSVHDPQVNQLKQKLSELNVLEHELALIQRESYHVLEKYLQLDELKISTIFPHWQHDKHKSHLKSMMSSSMSSLSSGGSGGDSVSTHGEVSSYHDTPGYSFSKNYKIKSALSSLSLAPPSSASEQHVRSGIPSPLPDDLDELMDDIRESRSKLLKYKEKKHLDNKDIATKFLLEQRLKEAEEKREEIVRRGALYKRHIV